MLFFNYVIKLRVYLSVLISIVFVLFSIFPSLIDPDKMEQVGIQPYLNTPYAKEWPTLNGPGNITSLNISDLNARYTPLSVFPLLKIGPGQDFADHSKHAVWVGTPQ